MGPVCEQQGQDSVPGLSDTTAPSLSHVLYVTEEEGATGFHSTAV